MVHFTRRKHTRMINHNTSLQFMELFASGINQIHRKKPQFTTPFQTLSASQDLGFHSIVIGSTTNYPLELTHVLNLCHFESYQLNF